MSKEQIGIEGLKSYVKFALELGNELGKALEDGKINFGEALGLIDNAVGIPKLINQAKQIPAELQDFSEYELQELKQYIAEEFDIENDKTELIIEEAVHLGFNIASGVTKIFKLAKK